MSAAAYSVLCIHNVQPQLPHTHICTHTYKQCMYVCCMIGDVIIVKCFNREHFVVARLQSLMQ